VQEEKTISLFSGAGLVKESDSSREWAETELKKHLILDAFKEIVG
jgi:isochorismate synthase EntC